MGIENLVTGYLFGQMMSPKLGIRINLSMHLMMGVMMFPVGGRNISISRMAVWRITLGRGQSAIW
ncbi:hypothetical protein WS90_31135 [Burkholderia cepacia]|uniref:Uncharacterized protein n=1 Tax=Burkholderia cepacia TaxID=292 RepID=A0A118KDI6_BURCE|nr:hypothetical protein WS90_31135 [Burkholderia cepacia]